MSVNLRYLYRRQLFCNLFASACLWCVSPLSSSGQEAMILDGVAAHVNKHVITIGEVLEIVERVRPQLMANFRGDELRKQMRLTYSRALNTLIARDLVLDDYKTSGAELPEWALEQRISQHIADRYKGDRPAFMDALAKEEQTYDEWRDDFERHFIISLMRSTHVEQNVSVSPLVVRKQFEDHREKYRTPAEYKIRMIQATPKGDDVEPARKRAESALERISQGDAFADVAKALSDDKRAEQGGDWGWIKAELVRPVLRETLLSLDAGGTSSIINTDGVFYIMHLDEKREEGEGTFENMQPLIERELRMEQSEILYEAWIARLRKNAYVKLFDVKL